MATATPFSAKILGKTNNIFTHKLSLNLDNGLTELMCYFRSSFLRNKVAFWLIPSKENRAYFQEIIDTLSQEYEAPSFTPHVTIYSGEYELDESIKSILELASQKVQSFSLSIDKLLYTEEFTKTIFVQFYQNSLLNQISEALSCASKHPSKFTLNPHLSLIYKHLDPVNQESIIKQLKLQKTEIFFNEISAILTPEKVQTQADVESWKVICKKNLQ